jgi:ABC-type transporter Mla subunit MlaD
MVDRDAGSFLGYIWPDWSQLSSGTVHMVTPLLVLVIWAIALGTCASVAYLAVRALRAISEVKGLITELTQDNLREKLGLVRAASEARSPLVRDAWREFDETLVVEHDRVFNTVSAEEFFNEHRFAPQLIGNRFIHAAPVALTTIGLLGTFFGLTVGLRGLELDVSADELRGGIQTLVEGAALGFTASLWGVFMSLVTNVFERSMERGVLSSCRKLQADIDKLFAMRSPEHSLSEIARSTSASNEALQVLHEKIGSAFQESVHEVGEGTSRAVSDAIHSSLAPIMEELAEKAANQSADVFQEISGQLGRSFADMGANVAEELRAAATSMRSTLDYMSEQLARQADQHLAQMNALREAAVSQLSSVAEAAERQMRLLDESLPRIIDGLDRTAHLVGTAASGMEGVTLSLASVTGGLQQTSTELSRMLGEALTAMDELTSRTSSAAGALESQQNTITDLLERASATAELLRTATATLNGGFDTMRTTQAHFLNDLEQHLERYSQAMAGWLASYGEEVSKQTAHRMSEWNAHTEQFSNHMLQVTQALSDAIDEISSRGAAGMEATV